MKQKTKVLLIGILLIFIPNVVKATDTFTTDDGIVATKYDSYKDIK